MALKFGLDVLGTTHQLHRNPVLASGQHRTVHDLAGRVIATHRVYGHSNHLRPQLSVN